MPIFLFGRLQIGIFLFGFGLFFSVLGAFDYLKSKSTPYNLNAIKESQIEKGYVLEGDIFANLGKFAYRGNDDYFIIPIGEESFCGLHVHNAEIHSQLMQQSRDTVEYIKDPSKTPQLVHFKGIIVGMSDEEFNMMVSYLSDAGFNPDDIQKNVKKYYLKELDSEFSMQRYIIAVPMFLIGIALIINEIRYRKSLRKA